VPQRGTFLDKFQDAHASKVEVPELRIVQECNKNSAQLACSFTACEFRTSLGVASQSSKIARVTVQTPFILRINGWLHIVLRHVCSVQL